MVPAVMLLAPTDSPDWGPFPVVTVGNSFLTLKQLYLIENEERGLSIVK